MITQCFAFPHPIFTRFFVPSQSNTVSAISSSSSSTTRRVLTLSLVSTALYSLIISVSPTSSVAAVSSKSTVSDFFELQDSGGVKALDLLVGSGEVPADGDKVAIHYYGRLAAKQGWRFDSTYDHRDENGEPNPFVFVLGSGKVISGIEAAVRSMKVGGIRRVVIPPSQGYKNTSQEPLPPNFLWMDVIPSFSPSSGIRIGWLFFFIFILLPLVATIDLIFELANPPSPKKQFFDRRRLFTTIFNPTRLANGEGSTLGTLIFDIELVSLKHQ